MLDKNLAFKVVDLVLDAHCQKTLRLQGERLALRIEGAHLDSLAAGDLLVYPGHGQAAFLADLLAGALEGPPG